VGILPSIEPLVDAARYTINKRLGVSPCKKDPTSLADDHKIVTMHEDVRARGEELTWGGRSRTSNVAAAWLGSTTARGHRGGRA